MAAVRRGGHGSNIVVIVVGGAGAFAISGGGGVGVGGGSGGEVLGVVAVLVVLDGRSFVAQ